MRALLWGSEGASDQPACGGGGVVTMVLQHAERTGNAVCLESYFAMAAMASRWASVC